MRVVDSMQAARAGVSGVVGLVPTMGFFHEGHLSLMERSASECDTTLVTLFVNPLQFEDPGDLDRYPTDLQRDLDLAQEVGVDMMVVPSLDEMYPSPPTLGVTVGRFGEVLEGAHRPGHLEGVATVVTKLFAGLQPHRAYFGRKDAQQLAMVTQLVSEFGFPIAIVGCPLVREPDGLALSSRNVQLGDHRAAALGLSAGLMAAADAIEAGERRTAGITRIVRETSRHIQFEYVAVVEANTMEALDEVDRHTVIAVAATVGGVRLIDNVMVDVADGKALVDRGSYLNEATIMRGPD